MSCLTTNEVVGFIAGDLPPADQAAVERHLDECAACRLLVTELARDEDDEGGAASTEAALATTTPIGIRPPAGLFGATPDGLPPQVTSAATATLGGHRVIKEVPGRYQVREELRRGGQARILRAFDTLMRREVALKELPLARPDAPPVLPGAEDAAAQARRFLREARITARLTHPAIVHVYEVGRRADGALYYSMPLVRGRTLAEAIAAASDLPARLALLGHFEALCQGVAYAHGEGVIHRDIKPENVMIGAFGETILLDWGLSKRLGRADDPESRRRDGLEEEALTAAGMTVGTPAYMSPEQAAGQLGQVDERSDVWGLGTVLYTLLTGRVPFTGQSTAELVERVLTARFPRVREVCPEAPEALAGVAEHALAREREGRPQSVRALLASFAQARSEAERDGTVPPTTEGAAPLVANASSLTAPRPGAAAPGSGASGRRGRLLLGAVGLTAVLALASLGLSLGWLDAEREARVRLRREAEGAHRAAEGARRAEARLGRELASAHLARAQEALRAQQPRRAKVYAAAALTALAPLERAARLRDAAWQCYARAEATARRHHPLRGAPAFAPEALRRADPRRLLRDAEREAGFTVAMDLAHAGANPPRSPRPLPLPSPRATSPPRRPQSPRRRGPRPPTRRWRSA